MEKDYYNKSKLDLEPKNQGKGHSRNYKDKDLGNKLEQPCVIMPTQTPTPTTVNRNVEPIPTGGGGGGRLTYC